MPLGTRRASRPTAALTAFAVHVERVYYAGLWDSRACRDAQQNYPGDYPHDYPGTDRIISIRSTIRRIVGEADSDYPQDSRDADS